MARFGHQQRQDEAAERAKRRSSRSTSEQIDLARTRRGESKKEIARLRGQLRKDSETKVKKERR